MRYKIVACNLLILSVFSFVLTAPIPVREVRDACADAMEGGEDVIIVSEKRAPRGNPYERGVYFSDSDTEWASPSESPSRPDYASTSGSHGGTSPSSLHGSESPMWSKVWSTPGGTAVPFDPETEIKQGTTTEDQLASSTKKKTVQWGPMTGDQSSSSSTPSKSVHWGPTTIMSPEDPHWLPPPPGRTGYLAKVEAQQLPKLQPQSKAKGFWSNVKTFFGKLGSKLKFRPRFLRKVDTRASTVGNLGELSNAPATSATGCVLRRSTGMSLHGPSDSPQSREQPAVSRGSANPMDEDSLFLSQGR